MATESWAVRNDTTPGGVGWSVADQRAVRLRIVRCWFGPTASRLCAGSVSGTQPLELAAYLPTEGERVGGSGQQRRLGQVLPEEWAHIKVTSWSSGRS